MCVAAARCRMPDGEAAARPIAVAPSGVAARLGVRGDPRGDPESGWSHMYYFDEIYSYYASAWCMPPSDFRPLASTGAEGA